MHAGVEVGRQRAEAATHGRKQHLLAALIVCNLGLPQHVALPLQPAYGIVLLDAATHLDLLWCAAQCIAQQLDGGAPAPAADVDVLRGNDLQQHTAAGAEHSSVCALVHPWGSATCARLE